MKLVLYNSYPFFDIFSASLGLFFSRSIDSAIALLLPVLHSIAFSLFFSIVLAAFVFPVISGFCIASASYILFGITFCALVVVPNTPRQISVFAISSMRSLNFIGSLNFTFFRSLFLSLTFRNHLLSPLKTNSISFSFWRSLAAFTMCGNPWSGFV